MEQLESHQLVPVMASLVVLRTLNASQINTLDRLIHDFNAGFARLWRDEWMNDSVLFALWTKADGDHLLTGLIEPDGNANT